MSTATRKPGQNAASRQGRKKMRILGVLAAVTLLTWSRQLFGGEGDEQPGAAGAKPGAGAEKSAVTAAAKGPKAAKSILNFEQAMERMTQWPEALNRRVIDGPIEDLSPVNWRMDPLPSLGGANGEPATGQGGVEPAPAATGLPSGGFEPPTHADGAELGIKLRSTVIFGSKRYAVLNGIRYAEGEVVIVDGGSGRYLLASVRSREVTLTSGGRSWILVIRDQSTPDTTPEQAE